MVGIGNLSECCMRCEAPAAKTTALNHCGGRFVGFL